MREDLNREKMHKAIDSALSGLEGDPWLFQCISARAGEGETKVKKKLSAGLVLAIVMILIAAVALAVTLLTHREVVEQVAVPMAKENDAAAGINESYTAEQLTGLIRTLNENGITLEENNILMQAIQNGRGYWEEETMMEICRQAFGGNFYTWTLEEQDWFERMMVDIGWYESYNSCLPGEDNMTYEAAEAYAFAALRKAYGEDLHPENRTLYQLSRQFYYDMDNGLAATWNFTLDPKDVDHGMYNVRFEDQRPDETVFCQAEIPDWTKPYTGDQLMSKFNSVYSWNHGKWPQSAWQRLHEMMLQAELDPGGYTYPEYKGYQMTEYPEPAESDLPREEAIRTAKEALQKERAALNSAVLTEYQGTRAWMVGLVIYAPEDGSEDEDAGNYCVTVDSLSGKAVNVRKQSGDDNDSMLYVPEAAYEKAREGILRESDYIRIAAEAIGKEYPDLHPLDENRYEARAISLRSNPMVRFITKNVQYGNASARIGRDGTVLEITVDNEPLTGDNLMTRYRAVYGYFGHWGQEIWVRLRKDMDALEPEGMEGKLLKMGQYPEENTVRIQHEEARELAIRASGKRTAEINTCVLIQAEPHPVWKLRVMADDPADQVIELDAETGEVVAKDIFKTDYTPTYVLYSLERNWRALALETEGPVQMARKAVTYAFGDLWQDFPEPDLENPDLYEIQQDGLTIRFDGRWKGMKSYLVELDENGTVLRCEEKESESQVAMAETLDDIPLRQHALDGTILPTPTPQPDGRLWFIGNEIADEAFWTQFEAAMAEYGVTQDNLAEKEREWLQEYGALEMWPQACYVLTYFMTQVDGEALDNMYPIFLPEGKPDPETLKEKAREAFHLVADRVTGADWVDSLRVSGFLMSDGIEYSSGEYYGKPVWFFSMEAYEEEMNSWNPKGFVQMDEDGNVLHAELDLFGNG